MVQSLIDEEEIDTALTFFNPMRTIFYNYICQMSDAVNTTSCERHNALRDELFEYFDSLPESERIRVLHGDEVYKEWAPSDGLDSFRCPGLDHLPDYLLPRLIDGRITKESLYNIIRGLFIKPQGPQISILRCGMSLLIVKLVLEGVLVYEELISMLDDIRASVNLNMVGNKVRLMFERYLPEEAVLELPEKVNDITGERCVEVPLCYRNVVVCVDVSKLILDAVFNSNEYEAVEKIIIICGGVSIHEVIFHTICPCIILVSDERARKMMEWFTQFDTLESYFPSCCPFWYISNDILRLESMIISTYDKPLSQYDRTDYGTNSVPLNRLNYLIATRKDDV